MADQVLEKGFAIYPYVDLKEITENPETHEKSKKTIKRLPFGDYIKPEIVDGAYVTDKIGKDVYIKVHCRNADGWIKKKEMQEERPVEINFIDVGQGDGCHIVTPDDKHYLIDAGKEDNMYRFLKWRFNLRSPKNKAPGFTVVITHSDEDHYKGFKTLFEKALPPQEDKKKKKAKKTQEAETEEKKETPQIRIKKIYHNGIIEGGGSALESLGTLVVKDDDHKYITDLCEKDSDYKKRVEGLDAGEFKNAKGEVIKAGKYVDMLRLSTAPKEALRAGTIEEPNYLYDKCGMKMEILGPVADMIDGKPALRVFGSSDTGKTKNGHSIVIKLSIGHLKLLLGGDLNTPAEYHLLSAYSHKDVAALRADQKDPEKQKELDEAILAANKYLGVDIAKSCHHGSDDFSSEFLRALNPIATVISSGDEEYYCHPRPDTLGTIGKYSRSKRPMIFSTELARSGKEFLNLDKLDLSAQKKKERVVTVYGMINVRTDGEKVIFAQKLEKKSPQGQTWDIHQMEWSDKLGDFELKNFKE